jgi:hypothetical protein
MRDINTLLYHIDYQCNNLTALKRADKTLTQYKQQALTNITGRKEPVTICITKPVNDFSGEGIVGT